MKKVLSIIAVAALSATFVACGPSKEEIEAREKAKADDSIAAVEKMKQDSIAAVEAQAAADAAAAAEKAKADSARIADSLAKLAPAKKK